MIEMHKDERLVILATKDGYVETQIHCDEQLILDQKSITELIPTCLDSSQNKYSFNRMKRFLIDPTGQPKLQNIHPQLNLNDILFGFEPNIYFDAAYTGDKEKREAFRKRENTKYDASFSLEDIYTLRGKVWNLEKRENEKLATDEFLTLHDAKIEWINPNMRLDSLLKVFYQYLKKKNNIFTINTTAVNNRDIHETKLYKPGEYGQDLNGAIKKEGYWEIGSEY